MYHIEKHITAYQNSGGSLEETAGEEMVYTFDLVSEVARQTGFSLF
jgi:hypothetical protein